MKKIVSIILSLVIMIEVLPAVSATSSDKSFDQYIIESIEDEKSTIEITSYMQKNGWTAKQALNEYQRVVYDNPQLFYVDGAVSYSARTSGGSIIYAEFNSIKYSATGKELKKQIEAFNTATDAALAVVDKDMKEVEKALALHDYLVANTAYDKKLKKYTAYDCLVSKTAVCQGYSLAYKYLMNKVGVECEMIASDEMNHAWNYVKIGKSWYHVDVTMDDPLFTASDKTKNDQLGYVSHEYLLLSDNAIKKSSTKHYGWNAKGLPAATSTTYDNYFWKTVKSEICKVGEYWYYMLLNSKSPGLNYSKTKSTKIETYLMAYSFETGKKVKKYTLDSTWTVWTNSKSWYQASYSKLCEYKGLIYFNSKDKIYVFNPTKNKVSTFKSPNTSKGFIYGIMMRGNKLRYSLKTNPTSKDSLVYAITIK